MARRALYPAPFSLPAFLPACVLGHRSMAPPPLHPAPQQPAHTHRSSHSSPPARMLCPAQRPRPPVLCPAPACAVPRAVSSCVLWPPPVLWRPAPRAVARPAPCPPACCSARLGLLPPSPTPAPPTPGRPHRAAHTGPPHTHPARGHTPAASASAHTSAAHTDGNHCAATVLGLFVYTNGPIYQRVPFSLVARFRRGGHDGRLRGRSVRAHAPAISEPLGNFTTPPPPSPLFFGPTSK
jgi:hypothetical protein